MRSVGLGIPSLTAHSTLVMGFQPRMIMNVVTAQEMRDIDRQTIEETGIPGVVLMENAGVAVVHAIEKRRKAGKVVSIFAGKGNNGGDGLVIGRHLVNRGYDVKIYLMTKPDRFTGDALVNLKIAQNMRLPMESILSEEQLEAHKGEIAASDLLIDAIFGTGLKGAVRSST